MRGIANERNALGNKGPGDEKSQRMDAPLADHFDVAEMELEPLFEFGVKFRLRQGHDALGLRRGFGPDDRGAISRQRQYRERAGGQKMLLGASVMIARVRDVYDNGRLAVAPAMGRDSRFAADGRPRAVGGDEQMRVQRLRITQPR